MERALLGAAPAVPMLDTLLAQSLRARLVVFLGPFATPIGEGYRYTLEGPGADPMTLRTLQDWVVMPGLLRVPGVADVVSYGGLVKELHVEPQPMKMAALGVVLDDVIEALGKASANASGGLVQRGA